jgi:electron transfer flavoprotein alpha subunit
VDSAPAVLLVGEDADEKAGSAIAALAEAYGAGLGGTATTCATGVIPPQLEVSVLRRSIAPKLCVAFGVRDAEALDPVRAAETIVTVHPDPGAPAHERADLAVLADAAEVAARLQDRTTTGTFSGPAEG